MKTLLYFSDKTFKNNNKNALYPTFFQITCNHPALFCFVFATFFQNRTFLLQIFGYLLWIKSFLNSNSGKTSPKYHMITYLYGFFVAANPLLFWKAFSYWQNYQLWIDAKLSWLSSICSIVSIVSGDISRYL